MKLFSKEDVDMFVEDARRVARKSEREAIVKRLRELAESCPGDNLEVVEVADIIEREGREQKA